MPSAPWIAFTVSCPQRFGDGLPELPFAVKRVQDVEGFLADFRRTYIKHKPRPPKAAITPSEFGGRDYSGEASRVLPRPICAFCGVLHFVPAAASQIIYLAHNARRVAETLAI